MSKKHYVTVQSSEYTRLRNADQARRALGNDVVNQVQSSMNRVQQGVDRRMSRTDSRIQSLESAVSNTRQDIRRVEESVTQQIRNHQQETRVAIQNTQQRIQQTRSELLNSLAETARQLEQADEETRRQLRSEIRETAQNLQNSIREQGNRLRREINQEREERIEQVQNLQRQIIGIVADREQLGEDATAWIEAAEIKRDFIEEHYSLSHEDRRRLERHNSMVQMAINNMSQDSVAEQTALVEAQTAWMGLTELLMDLEEREREWHILREQAIITAQGLLAEAQANRRLNRHQVGEELPDEISEVDYWADGQLSELVNELNVLIERAENDEDSSRLTLDELRTTILQTLPESDNRLGEIVDRAVVRVIRSQVRVSMADLAIQGLEAQNFRLVDGATYEGGDMRNGFVAKAEAHDGSEVIVFVVPDGENDRLEINYDERTLRSNDELMRRSRSVIMSMQDRGLPIEISDVEHASDTPDLTNQNLEEVRTRNVRASNHTARRSSS